MTVAVGSIVEGVVTGIMKFGAFVSYGEDESGLVHISEISHDYIEKVEDALSKGDKVKVKVVSRDPSGKVALSMKAAMPKPAPAPRPTQHQRGQDSSFEDKLSKFLKVSNEKIESVRQRNNSRNGGKRRGRR